MPIILCKYALGCLDGFFCKTIRLGITRARGDMSKVKVFSETFKFHGTKLRTVVRDEEFGDPVTGKVG